MAEKENEKETEKEKAAEKEKKEKPVTIKQLSKLRLGRESLEKWINEKDFEEIIQGCFVRVLLGEKQGKRLYRIAVIRGVQNSDAVYKIGDSFTTKLLVLNSGNAHKTFKMDFISNGDFTADEYKEWQEQMQKCGLPPLTTKDVDRKIKHIKSFVQKKKLQAQAAASAPKADDTEPAQLEPPADEASKEQSAVKRPPEEPLDDSEAPAKRQRVADIVTREESVEEPIEDKNLKPPAQEVVEVDAAVEGIEEEVPPGPDYNTALANANSYYNIVQGHHDEQSQYLAELQEANTELKDCIASLQQHMGELATELDKKRTAAGEMLDDGSVWEEEATRELAERQKGYEEELEVMKKEVRKRDRMLLDRENDIADIQKQLQKAKTLADAERASLKDHLARKEKQLCEIQRQHKDAQEKLQQAQAAVQEQQQVISLQDHTMNELETQLRKEHAEAIVTQQKRRKQALVLQQRRQEHLKLREEDLALQDTIKALVDPSYVRKGQLRSTEQEVMGNGGVDHQDTEEAQEEAGETHQETTGRDGERRGALNEDSEVVQDAGEIAAGDTEMVQETPGECHEEHGPDKAGMAEDAAQDAGQDQAAQQKES